MGDWFPSYSDPFPWDGRTFQRVNISRDSAVLDSLDCMLQVMVYHPLPFRTFRTFLFRLAYHPCQHTRDRINQSWEGVCSRRGWIPETYICCYLFFSAFFSLYHLNQIKLQR